MTETATQTTDDTRTASEWSAPEGWRVTPDGTVPVADVIRTAGVPHGAVDHAVRACGIPVVGQHGQGRRRYISVSDALVILAAAALATVAGVALSQMYRALQGSNVTVSGSALTIPLNFGK
ncbi:hypothetical protein [Streptomyces sp. S1]|uniref:hypothetical protein n=1 Tax=Streptomyces sp. S1 TaxID=718288 RepID=UPI000EF79766|nr:hypothetical protein [Streptomyces sp. S1]